MPTDNLDAGLSSSSAIQGRYVESVAVGNQDGVITVTFGNDVNQVISGETITLTADTSDPGSVQWVCASGGVIENKHLPAACR